MRPDDAREQPCGLGVRHSGYLVLGSQVIADPAKRATSGRKPKGFVMQPMSQAKRNKAEVNGRMSHAMLSMASDERILANTPNLKAIHEFLAKDKA